MSIGRRLPAALLLGTPEIGDPEIGCPETGRSGR
jgi:hypothetical protein